MKIEESKRKVKPKKSKLGFTLLELMVGIGLFTFALFPTMLMLGDALALGKFAENRNIAMNEARRVVEDIRQLADTDGLSALVGASWSGTVLPSENISVTDSNGVALANDDDPQSVQVTVSWSEKGKTVSYSVETLVTER